MEFTILLASLALAGGPGASRETTPNDLASARAAFAAADADRSGRLTRQELVGSAWTAGKDAFEVGDTDGDGAWSRDEFTVQFRAEVQRSGGKPTADLEAEAVRLLALRRARIADEARSRGGPGAARLGGTLVTGLGATPEILDLDARIERALLDLEDRAAGRGAVRADFDRVRSLWNERATLVRKLDGEVANVTDPSPRLLRALETLQAKAGAGSVPRSQFGDLRAAWGERPRRSVATALPATAVSIEARFAETLAVLEKRAVAGSAGREDFARVRELLLERARRAAQRGGPALPAVDDPRVLRLVTESSAELSRLEAATAREPVRAGAFDALRRLFESPANRPAGPGSRDARR